MDKRLAFEEFQLFYESAERVTERRIALNRWNYSICSAILLAIAAILNWIVSNPNFFAVATGLIVVLCAMAFLYCTFWIAQIRDYKKLNGAKFAILNDMAPLLSFGADPQDTRCSYEPFAKEWDALIKSQTVEDISSISIVALKSSNVEYLIPRAFRVLFCLVFAAALLATVANWTLFLDSMTIPIMASR